MSELMIKSTVASLQSGAVRVDGKLVMFESKVQFEPFNPQAYLGPYTFKTDSIVHVERCLGKGAGVFPVTTDAIRITLDSGDEYEFIVAYADDWVEMLCRLQNTSTQI